MVLISLLLFCLPLLPVFHCVSVSVGLFRLKLLDNLAKLSVCIAHLLLLAGIGQNPCNLKYQSKDIDFLTVGVLGPDCKHAEMQPMIICGKVSTRHANDR